MQIEEQVFKKHRDTQKVPLGGTVPPSVTPSQHTVQGQTCQQGEVCLGPFAAEDVHFSNQAIRYSRVLDKAVSVKNRRGQILKLCDGASETNAQRARPDHRTLSQQEKDDVCV